MPRVTRTTHRVTADHIRYLAARTNTSKVLADTTNGIALIDANSILTPGSNAIRVLLGKHDLIDTANGLGLTMTEYLDLYATEVASDLNRLRDSEGGQP
jgi:hypothetical protein